MAYYGKDNHNSSKSRGKSTGKKGEGASLQDGLSARSKIKGVSPADLGLDTTGKGQVPQHHPTGKAPRGTRWGP